MGWHGPQLQFQGLRWIESFVHEASLLVLTGYFLYRRGLRFADLGLRWTWRDIGPTLGVTVASYLFFMIGHFVMFLARRGVVDPSYMGVSAQQVFGHPSIMAIPLILLNPFFEELIVRAYLMTEVSALTGSWVLAGVASVLLQTSYHLYYGWGTALALGWQFAVFAAYYAWRRRIAPVIVAHGIFDVIGMARLL